MKAFHQSRQSRYRHPYGALPAHSLVTLAISISQGPDETSPVTGVYLCYAYGLYQFMESRQHMVAREHPAAQQADASGLPLSDDPTKDYWTSVTLPSEPGLFFYWFEIQCGDNRVYYTCDLYGDGSGWLGHHRPHYQPADAHHPNPFQITIYDPDFTVPEWLIGAVIYQIFPDRFHRDREFSIDRFRKAAENRPERIFHADWHEDVDYQGKPDTGYLACDFFGGSLRGITEKLDYLEQLGVTVLYLNPIFEARSNHRYDTGNYEHVDPLLGTNADLMELCREASQRDIHVMLDGVFSHTGADSRYFNKFGRYPDMGAYQEMTGKGRSDYTTWYTFHRKGDDLFYDSWWGFPDLPNVSEHDLSFIEYICGPNGILRTWLRRGISGFRLDVSDELPDNFLRDIRRTMRREMPEAAVLGEVWENASHKISYGSYRDFLFGRTHDSIMGYPFQKALLDWFGQHISSHVLINQLESIRESYPLASFYAGMNLISSHDIPRAITILSGLPDPGNRDLQAKTFLSPPARARGLALLRLCYLFQIAFPGMAAIYYGDEAGQEGYRDPFNRRTYPWGREETELIGWFQKLGQLRKSWPVLKTGLVRLAFDGEQVLVIERFLDLGRDAFGQIVEGHEQVRVAINRSPHEVRIPWSQTGDLLPPFGGILQAGAFEIRTSLDYTDS